MAKGSGTTRTAQGGSKASLFLSKESSYDALVGKTGETWNKLTEDEKMALATYTGRSYADMQRAIITDSIKGSQWEEKINAATSAIEKSTYNRDIVMVRGTLDESPVFGFNITKASPEQLNNIVGKTYKMKQFGSFSASQGKDYDYNGKIILTAPKGTKMIYAEPFSSHGASVFGGNNSVYWDGKRQKNIRYGENEILLQRGTSYKVDKVRMVGGKTYVYATVVKQDKQ